MGRGKGAGVDGAIASRRQEEASKSLSKWRRSKVGHNSCKMAQCRAIAGNGYDVRVMAVMAVMATFFSCTWFL
ncbi:hypothetical protein NDU88_006245 [Pleurodeles waltl]|uniref:Uncharacterized protein n=1 Tax=Pleurodeles waltl TaxID=8319 RepID=A0AAV7UKG1_PLEWA|nr:hypothetical protein NDU88_006245 [Pleurodeles waltl]